MDTRSGNGSATYADIVALPPHLVGELMDGELVVSPRPSPAHGRASSDLGALLGPPFRFGSGGPGGWWLLDEPELHLDSAVLVPDLAGWRRERLPALPSEPFFTLPPDWICEVLSPSTAAWDRTRKLSLYHRVGVRHAWLLDPLARTLEIYRTAEPGWLLAAVYCESEQIRAEPFEAIALDLGLLWDAPAP